MLNDEQQAIFSHLLTTYWSLGRALDSGDTAKASYYHELSTALKNKLKESMGQEAFDDFIEKKGTYLVKMTRLN